MIITKGKKLTLGMFQADIKEQVEWNSRIGFWHYIFHEMYLRGKMKYQDALKECTDLAEYTGA